MLSLQTLRALAQGAACDAGAMPQDGCNAPEGAVTGAAPAADDVADPADAPGGDPEDPSSQPAHGQALRALVALSCI